MKYIVLDNGSEEIINRTLILINNIVTIDEYEDGKKHFDIRITLSNNERIFQHYKSKEEMEEMFERIRGVIEDNQ